MKFDYLHHIANNKNEFRGFPEEKCVVVVRSYKFLCIHIQEDILPNLNKNNMVFDTI